MSRTRWTVAAFVSVGAALLALVYREELAASTLGSIALVALLAPALVTLYVLVHVLGEGAVLLLLLGAFKVVTLGQVRIGFPGAGMQFSWHGFARADDGSVVASENAMALIGIATYAVAGLAAYFFSRT
ncbi:hypothetical protein [Variovorax sp. KBW07]|uniref:hypothetical protein n=1 Tax=Variovorax sp. KBW07 TaxID=2153358 RepID=UPI000F566904|nr:hypothetical protein [Variovorax sp. KBW07]